MKLKQLKKELQAVAYEFDGDGHSFFFKSSEDYENAQHAARDMMQSAKSSRPRGWSRGRDAKGRLFVRIMLH